MLDAGVSSAIDPRVDEIYQELKVLVKTGQDREARAYLRTDEFGQLWEALLLHSMMRRNCPVTKVIMIAVINCRLLKPSEIQLRVSQVDHRIQLDFAKRVQVYSRSQEFASEFERYKNVRNVAVTQLRGGIGADFLNPNKFQSQH